MIDNQTCYHSSGATGRNEIAKLIIKLMLFRRADEPLTDNRTRLKKKTC